MLLPSRSNTLNYHINEFNRSILDLTCRLGNVSIIDNSMFGGTLTNEFGRWDSVKQQPFAADLVHLGKKGIRTLAVNFKNVILGKRTQSRSRFGAGHGSYQTATDRSAHRDGYQPPR